MFRLYSGEYLVTPVPLHFGFNYCSHGCFYCFANLNNPERRVNAQSAVKAIKNASFGKSNTVESWLLNNGYPVLMANDSDPLAASNVDVFLDVHQAFADAGIRMCYQTKGGASEYEDVMLSDRPTMIYVSLTSDDEKILKDAEPGAPGHEHRMRFIERARAAGHFVIAGINPLVPHWWSDFDALLDRLHAAGVSHIWTGSMHLAPQQISNMPQSQQDRFESEIFEARKKRRPVGYDDMITKAKSQGFRIFEAGSCDKPGFWNDYFQLGFPFYPTADSFFEHLTEVGGGDAVLFDYDYFSAWADIGCGNETTAFKDFIRPFRRRIYNQTGQEPRIVNYEQVNRVFFDVLSHNNSPLMREEIYFATAGRADDPALLVDERGLANLVFHPDPNVMPGSVDWNIDLYPANYPKQEA